MTHRSILAVTDFSMEGHHALNRAALLSAEHGSVLHLACFSDAAEAPPADALIRLARHAQQLSQKHGVVARAASDLAHKVDDLLPAASAADLVVWGAAPASGLRSLIFGQPVEELIRRAQRPVLVARNGATRPYRSLLVAVDLSGASRALVDASLSLNKAARVELFHAISTANEGKLRYAEVSDHAIRAYREQCRRHARDRLFWLTDSYDARRNRVQSTIAHGDAARQALVQQQRSGAELIVVGKHSASTFSEFLFGSVASRLLNMSDVDGARTDILVVPRDWRPAARRVRAGAPQIPTESSPGPVPRPSSAAAAFRRAA